MASQLKPLWRCPKCGARFVTANMWHSCGKFTVDGHYFNVESLTDLDDEIQGWLCDAYKVGAQEP